ncbi:protein Nazo [Nomia melanderi]|uniref:protein Nazo n=1 Tax=Nomia melanderi TaxID=2448451 RepID=UPI0013043BFD|nr:protein C19orf12 homolog [Nomia melanderi]
MSLTQENVLTELSNLDCVKQLKINSSTALKYGMVVGLATAACGVLAGPVGLTIGGVVSSCVVGYKSNGKFKSAIHILLYETTPEQKRKLHKEIMKYLNIRHIKTIYDFVRSMTTNQEVMNAVINIIIMFITSELHYNVTKA